MGLVGLLMHFQPGTGRPQGGTETSLALANRYRRAADRFRAAEAGGILGC